eukprot:585434-Pelagomonas_calceolata.AAC.1
MKTLDDLKQEATDRLSHCAPTLVNRIWLSRLQDEKPKGANTPEELPEQEPMHNAACHND